MKISPIKILSILYILLMSNILFTKLNKHLIEFLNTNTFAKHILTFITIIVLITLVYSHLDISELIFYAVIIFILFILSTKSTYHVNLIILGILFILYMLDYTYTNKISDTVNSQLSYENKKNIISKFKIKKNHSIIFFAIAVVAGALLYDSKKYNQYKDKYSLMVFVS